MTKNLLTTMVVLAMPALAQTTVKDALVKHWKVTSDFTIAVAKQMPADSYNFRPVPEELSFSQLIIQIAGANMSACGQASGMTGPATPEKILQALKEEKNDKLAIGKDEAVQFLTDTFKFCNEAVASMTPEKLDAVEGRTRKMTGFEWLWAYFTHTAHHRGQAEVYLRLKGITPTTYTF